ncbi:MAG: hypothetical protein AAFP00_07290 [Bacteroidota bacterium]
MSQDWTPELRRLFAELLVGLSRHTKVAWWGAMDNGFYAGTVIGAHQSVINLFKATGLTYDTPDEDIDLDAVRRGEQPRSGYPEAIEAILPFPDDVIRGFFENTPDLLNLSVHELLSSYFGLVCEFGEPLLSSSTSSFSPPKEFIREMEVFVENGFARKENGEYRWTMKVHPAFMANGLWNTQGVHRDESRRKEAEEFFASHFDQKSLTVAQKICAEHGRLMAAEALDVMHEQRTGRRTDKFLSSLIFDAGWFDPFARSQS